MTAEERGPTTKALASSIYERMESIQKQKETNFAAFQGLNLEHFRAIRGRSAKVDVSSTVCFLQDCNKLENFEEVEIDDLWY